MSRFSGPDPQREACWPHTRMLMAPPAEAWGDNHPLESRPLMLTESVLMTHTNSNAGGC